MLKLRWLAPMLLLLHLSACSEAAEECGPAMPAAKDAKPVSATYDVADLVRRTRANPTASPELLVDAIRLAVAPDVWEQEGVSVEVRENRLVVVAPQSVHDELKKFLAARRAGAEKK
ncbi:MAG: hypothetical protein ACYTEZ_10775 [Planctomycetota bacterium]